MLMVNCASRGGARDKGWRTGCHPTCAVQPEERSIKGSEESSRGKTVQCPTYIQVTLEGFNRFCLRIYVYIQIHMCM